MQNLISPGQETSDVEPSIFDTCPATGLPIIQKPEWTDIHFDKTYRATISVVGESILWVKASGSVTLSGAEDSLKLTQQILSETITDNRPYVRINDWSDFKGFSLEARKCFTGYLKKCEGLSGMIFYGASPISKMSIKLANRLNIFKFDTHIVDTYAEAVTLALKLLAQEKVLGIKPVKAALNQTCFEEDTSSTEQETLCQVTGLPIIAKPAWTDIDVTENYSVSFSIIGNAILCTAPRGIPSAEGFRRQIGMRKMILSSAGLLGTSYAELRDYSGLAGKPSKENRLLLTDLLLKEINDGNLLGFWVYNTPLAVKWMFNVGTKLYKPLAPVAAVTDYKTAIENAVKVLEKSGINPGTKQYSRFTKDDWSIEREDYGIRFELIGDDILYSITYGSLKEAYIEQFFNLCQKVFGEAGLTAKGYYYRILNWEKLERPSWKARKMYIERLKELHQKVACKCSVVFGLNPLSRAVISISKPFVHFPIVTANSLDDALAIIEREKSKSPKIEIAKKEVKPVAKIFTEEQIRGYSDDLLEFMGFINWDKQGVANEPIIDSHPFKALFDAIAIIKGDVDDLLSERQQAEETLRASEEKYRTILENMEQGYSEYDIAGNFTFFNDSMCKILGYSRDELMGMNNRQYMDKENAAKAYQAFNHVYTTGEPERGFVCDFIRKDGVKRQMGFSISLMKDSDGHRVGFRGIAGDITERKIFQNQLLQAQKMESIGQLAAGIAHEVNTPTQYVSDNTHFVQDAFDHIIPILKKYAKMLKAVKAGAVPENIVEEVETAIEAADIDYFIQEIPIALRQSLEGLNRTTDIIKAMKEFSHPGTKEKVPVDINQAIQSTITVARNEWKYVADIQTDFDATIPPVPCLAGEFNQAILNLIVNAANAVADIVGDRSEEKGTITVSTGRVDHWVEIRISDTGAGIPELIGPKIFDPFFTTKEIGKGTGQGLAIAQAVIVKKHNGTIRFETEVGKGTTFIVRLPIANEKHQTKV